MYTYMKGEDRGERGWDAGPAAGEGELGPATGERDLGPAAGEGDLGPAAGEGGCGEEPAEGWGSRVGDGEGRGVGERSQPERRGDLGLVGEGGCG